MKFLRALFLSVLLTGPASAADYVAGPSGGSNLPGTRTNDNACAGCVGEFVGINIPTGQTATVTITIAAPGVISWTAHGFTAGTGVNFSTSGALPTGLTAFTTYYVTAGASLLTNSFEVSTTPALAFAGTAITTTGSQSGTQTGTAGAAMGSSVAIYAGAVNLSAGDWNCWGALVSIAGSGTTISSLGGTITTGAASNAVPTTTASTLYISATLNTSGTNYLPIGTIRVSAAVATPVYLSAFGTFAVSGMNAGGTLSCRRAR